MRLFNFSHGYSPLKDSDAEPKGTNRNGRRNRINRGLLAVNISMFLFSMTVAFVWAHGRYFALNHDLRRTSTWSPIHDLVDLDMKSRFIDGTVFPGDNPSVAREMPNQAADLTWQEWEEARIIPVTKADILRLGKNPNTAFKLENSVWGLGDDAYAANLDIYHQLHCLNTIREIAYGNYYNASMGNAHSEEIYEVHLNHCVDILVQALQCSGNVNLVTLHWQETQPDPMPDFSINRQCVAFDRLTEWRKEHSVDRQIYLNKEVKMPKDHAMEPASPKMMAWARKHAGEYYSGHDHGHGHS